MGAFSPHVVLNDGHNLCTHADTDCHPPIRRDASAMRLVLLFLSLPLKSMVLPSSLGIAICCCGAWVLCSFPEIELGVEPAYGHPKGPHRRSVGAELASICACADFLPCHACKCEPGRMLSLVPGR